jgi:hypothetical protein
MSMQTTALKTKTETAVFRPGLGRVSRVSRLPPSTSVLAPPWNPAQPDLLQGSVRHLDDGSRCHAFSSTAAPTERIPGWIQTPRFLPRNSFSQIGTFFPFVLFDRRPISRSWRVEASGVGGQAQGRERCRQCASLFAKSPFEIFEKIVLDLACSA